jgi:hypothetical protein
MADMSHWLAVLAVALAFTAVICIAVSWWVMADPWAIFAALAHSYHSGVQE